MIIKNTTLTHSQTKGLVWLKKEQNRNDQLRRTQLLQIHKLTSGLVWLNKTTETEMIIKKNTTLTHSQTKGLVWLNKGAKQKWSVKKNTAPTNSQTNQWFSLVE